MAVNVVNVVNIVNVVNVVNIVTEQWTPAGSLKKRPGSSGRDFQCLAIKE